MLQRQTLAQMADSLTVVPATDPESLIPLVDSVTAPYGHGPVTNIQHRTQQESHPPVSHVTNLLTSVLAMDAQAAHALALASLSHQSCLPSDQAGDMPIHAPEAGL